MTLSSLVRSSARWAAARRAHWRAKPQAARATGQEPKAKSHTLQRKNREASSATLFLRYFVAS